MKYYSIQNNNVLIAENESALTKYYENVFVLPEDYEPMKYIIGEKESNVEVSDSEAIIDDYGQEMPRENVADTERKTVKVLVLNPNFEAEKTAAERARLDGLTLTAADVERAVYKAKRMDFDDLIAYVSTLPDIDIKALKIELRANNFYRNHPYINQLGALLGYTSDDLDFLFEHKILPEKGTIRDNG